MGRTLYLLLLLIACGRSKGTIVFSTNETFTGWDNGENVTIIIPGSEVTANTFVVDVSRLAGDGDSNVEVSYEHVEGVRLIERYTFDIFGGSDQSFVFTSEEFNGVGDSSIRIIFKCTELVGNCFENTFSVDLRSVDSNTNNTSVIPADVVVVETFNGWDIGDDVIMKIDKNDINDPSSVVLDVSRDIGDGTSSVDISFKQDDRIIEIAEFRFDQTTPNSAFSFRSKVFNTLTNQDIFVLFRCANDIQTCGTNTFHVALTHLSTRRPTIAPTNPPVIGFDKEVIVTPTSLFRTIVATAFWVFILLVLLFVYRQT